MQKGGGNTSYTKEERVIRSLFIYINIHQTQIEHV